MAMNGEKSKGTVGSYLDCADEILVMMGSRSKAQLEVISQNHCFRSGSAPDLPWDDWTKLLHRAFILATQI
jgi:hypothetical protein